MLNSFLTKITPIALALNYQAIDENELVKIIMNYFCALIALIGILFGAWELFQGVLGDTPGDRKKGITYIIIGVSIAGVVYAIMQMVLNT